MRRTRIFPIALLVLVTAGLGACGPDSSDTTPATEPTATPAGSAAAGDGPPTPRNRRPALAVVERYYQALDGGQLRRAHDLWSESTRGSFEELTRRHEGLRDVRVELGEPGDVRRAGDVRLLDVPVTVYTETDGGSEMRSGTVTVRRSVAPGASRADRRWKIDRIELGPAA